MAKVGTWIIVLLMGCLFSSFAVGSESTTTDTETIGFIEQYRVIRQDAERKLASLQEKAEREIDLTIDLASQRDLIDDINAQSETIISAATEQVFALVKPHATESGAAEPLAWVATRRSHTDSGRSALELLTQHHLVRAETIELAVGLSRNGNPLAESLLRTQLSSADLPQELRWKVMLSLSRLLQSNASIASHLSSATDEELARFIRIRGKEHVDAMKTLDVNALEEEAIALFSEIEQMYPEQEVIPGLTAAEFAKSSLFEIRNLRIGKVAPDISGEDLNGEAFKLSDYRGKVVLLSFWATWCGPCMAEIPHERKLVELYSERPFAIVGVNADMDNTELQRALKQFGISWRSFSCGSQGPLGPIAKEWNVSRWPTVYLIDHTGVIRGKNLNLRGEALEAKLAELISEAERATRESD